MTRQTNSQRSQSSGDENQQSDTAQDLQPESGAVDRQNEMETRQSSPTNPRVSDKSEDNQEEA